MKKMDLIKEGFKKLNTNEKAIIQAQNNLEEWLTKKEFEEYLPYIDHLIEKEKWGNLLDCFWRMMPFGTGGRRGPVGAGPNRINPYTIGLSVQGHCEYLRNTMGYKGDIKVVVAHDVRQFFDLRGIYKGIKGVLYEISSLDMAKVSAMTYAANGIKAYVVGPLQTDEKNKKCVDRYISTPELSFLIREYSCMGGLNVSASHNHPDDNGGKFYNRQGGQEIPPDDEKLLKVVEKVKEIKTMDYDEAVTKGLIEFVSKQAHKKYIDLNVKLAKTASRSAKLGFTPLCGTGMTTVYETFKELDYEVALVNEQAEFDGTFKPVRYRIGNPEVPDSMDKLDKVCREEKCDIGFSTDPDADRLGIIAKNKEGEFVFYNGNEIGVLLIQSIVTALRKNNKLPKNGFFVNTVVTSSLQRTIAKEYGLQVVGDLMVGFKYIGDVLREVEESGRYPAKEDTSKDNIVGKLEDFVFGTEESHGYLLTTEVRDKDATGAAVQLAGLVSDLKDQDRVLDDMLKDIYKVYGYHRNVLRSLVMEGIEGLALIGKIQDVLRKNPPKQIAGLDVIRFVDNHIVGGELKSSTDEASRNVLLFELDGKDGVIIRLVVRPSGTEPKTKIYVEVPSTKKIGGNLDSVSQEQLNSISDAELNSIIDETNNRAEEIGNEFIRYCLGKEVLGSAFEEIPAESLLVSDLVTVENKLAFCNDLMPELVEKIIKGEDTKIWINESLKSYGEDAIGLVKKAAITWAVNHAEEKGLNDENLKKVKALFCKCS